MSVTVCETKRFVCVVREVSMNYSIKCSVNERERRIYLCMLIHLGTIFGMLVANERVSLDVSDIRAGREVTGVFYKRYVISFPIK